MLQSQNVFGHIHSIEDVIPVANSLINKGTGADKFWASAAQVVLQGIIAALYVDGKRTNKELWLAVTSPIPVIADLCASVSLGTEGCCIIADPTSKQAIVVVSWLWLNLRWLELD